MLFLAGASFGVDLSGVVSVNQTSSTAANAKNAAMNTARRQILFDVLSRYSDKGDLERLLSASSDSDLVDLVASSTVSDEQISDDSYLATVTMNLDNNAVRRWLNNNGIRNWVPTKDEKVVAEQSMVFFVVQNGISDWAELKRIARAYNIEIDTQSMSGNQIVAKIPLDYRTKFAMAVREAGWKYADTGGVLQIWK